MKMFSPTTPFFFRMLLKETLMHNKLFLPRKFVITYGNTLSNQVVLKLPCGSEWEIGLKKYEDVMWLETGWSKFVEFYSLEYGSMIAFRYKGDSKFDAFIFDKTTVEIDYPTRPKPFEKPIDDQFKYHNIKREIISDDNDDDDSFEMLESFSAGKKAKESSFGKKMKTSVVSKTRGKFVGSGKQVVGGKCTTSKGKSKASCFKILESFSAGQKAKEVSSSKRAKTSLESKSKGKFVGSTKQAVGGKCTSPQGKHNASCFNVVIKPSYFTGKHDLHVPSKFTRSYMTKLHGNVSLSASDGRSWTVKYRVRYKPNGTRVGEICRGWTEFVRDNNLNVGDVCNFKLVNRKGLFAFQVSFTRASKNACDDQFSLGQKIATKPAKLVARREQSKATEESGRFHRKSPQFRVTMNQSYLAKGALHIPTAFSRRYLEKKTPQVVILKVGRRSWAMRMVMSSIRFRILSGWHKFVKENSLALGNVCEFKLIKSTGNVTMKVCIFR